MSTRRVLALQYSLAVQKNIGKSSHLPRPGESLDVANHFLANTSVSMVGKSRASLSLLLIRRLMSTRQGWIV